uniref:Uncharacterized protein n=1 Tax=Sphaerodactylus townsendi TaxID=933632 RepID=A0ACB8EB69_9SAUR
MLTFVALLVTAGATPTFTWAPMATSRAWPAQAPGPLKKRPLQIARLPTAPEVPPLRRPQRPAGVPLCGLTIERESRSGGSCRQPSVVVTSGSGRGFGGRAWLRTRRALLSAGSLRSDTWGNYPETADTGLSGTSECADLEEQGWDPREKEVEEGGFRARRAG